VQTERLRLRKVSAGDVPGVVTLSCDPRVNEQSPSGPPTIEQAEATARGFVEDWQRDGLGYWIVEHGGQMVGVAGVRRAEFDGSEYWNLYYRFSPLVWGQGLAAEAARTAITVARQYAPGRPVLARTRPSNLPAARLALAVGMCRDPTLDSNGFITFGRPPDSRSTGRTMGSSWLLLRRPCGSRTSECCFARAPTRSRSGREAGAAPTGGRPPGRLGARPPGSPHAGNP
jgi:ribosomal-protein-alanine N-acetyltransferase